MKTKEEFINLALLYFSMDEINTDPMFWTLHSKHDIEPIYCASCDNLFKGEHYLDRSKFTPLLSTNNANTIIQSKDRKLIIYQTIELQEAYYPSVVYYFFTNIYDCITYFDMVFDKGLLYYLMGEY